MRNWLGPLAFGLVLAAVTTWAAIGAIPYGLMNVAMERLGQGGKARHRRHGRHHAELHAGQLARAGLERAHLANPAGRRGAGDRVVDAQRGHQCRGDADAKCQPYLAPLRPLCANRGRSDPRPQLDRPRLFRRQLRDGRFGGGFQTLDLGAIPPQPRRHDLLL